MVNSTLVHDNKEEEYMLVNEEDRPLIDSNPYQLRYYGYKLAHMLMNDECPSRGHFHHLPDQTRVDSFEFLSPLLLFIFLNYDYSSTKYGETFIGRRNFLHLTHPIS